MSDKYATRIEPPSDAAGCYACDTCNGFRAEGQPCAFCAAEIAEVARRAAQLPEGMEDCTITYHKCHLGHGWLSAKNWVQHGCPTCLERLNAEARKVLAEVRENMEAAIAGRDAAKARLKDENEKWLAKYAALNDDIRARLGADPGESTQEAAYRVVTGRDDWKARAAQERDAARDQREQLQSALEEEQRQHDMALDDLRRQRDEAYREREAARDNANAQAKRAADAELRYAADIAGTRIANPTAGNALVRVAIGEYNRTGIMLNLTPVDVAAILAEAVKVWWPVKP